MTFAPAPAPVSLHYLSYSNCLPLPLGHTTFHALRPNVSCPLRLIHRGKKTNSRPNLTLCRPPLHQTLTTTRRQWLSVLRPQSPPGGMGAGPGSPVLSSFLMKTLCLTLPNLLIFCIFILLCLRLLFATLQTIVTDSSTF